MNFLAYIHEQCVSAKRFPVLTRIDSLLVHCYLSLALQLTLPKNPELERSEQKSSRKAFKRIYLYPYPQIAWEP